MNDSPMKPRILELLRFAHQEEQQLVGTLSAAERRAAGTAERWSAKDILVNIMLWKELQTQKLAMAVRGEVPPEWRDGALVASLNNQAREKYLDVPLESVQQEAGRIFAAFMAQVE